MKKYFIIVSLTILVMSLFLLPVNAAEGDFSISTPLLYQSDNTHSVLYVSNGVQTQCVVMEHEYWDDPEVNPTLSFWAVFYPYLYDINGDIELNYSFIEFAGDDSYNISVYDAFSGNLIYSSYVYELPQENYDGSIGMYHYPFPDTSYKYVYKWFPDDDFYAPVEIIMPDNSLPINSIQTGTIYNIVRVNDDQRLNNVSALFYAFLNWVSNIVDTIKSSPILMLTLGIFVTGAVIGLSYRIIHK